MATTPERTTWDIISTLMDLLNATNDRYQEVAQYSIEEEVELEQLHALALRLYGATAAPPTAQTPA